MMSAEALNARNTEDARKLEEYVVSESFVLFRDFLVQGQKLACILGVVQIAKHDTQAAFLGFLPGISRRSCVQVTCSPSSQEDLKWKPWIPMCLVMVDKRVVRGAFIMNFNGLENLAQSALDSGSSNQLRAYYIPLLFSPIGTVELQHRINARLVAAQQEILRTLLNPADLEQSAQAACQRFELMSFTYYRLWPNDTGCPPDARGIAAKEMGQPLYQDLQVKLAVPLTLLNQSVPVSLKPMLRFPGGGGSTDHGLCHTWLYPADLEQAELANAFICDIELPLPLSLMGP
ncbi:hypothetical protein J1614_012211, partial [Plenodomus biglobosus]